MSDSDAADFDEHSSLSPMSITTTTDEGTKFSRVSSASSSFNTWLKYSIIPYGNKTLLSIILLSFAIIFYIVFSIKSRAASSMSNNKNSNLRFSDDGIGDGNNKFENMPPRPHNLRALISSTTEKARKSKTLQSLSISPPEYIIDNGIEFLISYAMKVENVDAKDASSTISSSAKNYGMKPDPFENGNIPPDLIISPIAPSYTLVLNKFNTIKDHSLLITNSFEFQSSALSSEDLEAWYWVIDSTMSVGFYNSNYISGASQRHKHMQIIPMDVMYSLRPDDASTALPIDDIISNRFIDTGKWRVFEKASSSSMDNIYTIPQFRFRHSVAVLMDLLQWAEMNRRNFSRQSSYAQYLEEVYHSLLLHSGIMKSPCSNKGSTGSSSANDAMKAKGLGLDLDEDDFCTGNLIILNSLTHSHIVMLLYCYIHLF